VDDQKVVAAIEKTGRKNLIMPGVTIDVCLAFAAMQAVEGGYNVYGVLDASGAPEVTIRENAVARITVKLMGLRPSTGLRSGPSCSGTRGCRPGRARGASSTTPQLRDGLFRVQVREWDPERVLAASRQGLTDVRRTSS
jgi:hypothetical protein